MPKFSCFNCSQHIDADDSLAGTMTTCPSCKTGIYVPGDPVATTVTLAANPYSPPNSRNDYPEANAKQVRHYGGIQRLPYLGIIFGLVILQAILSAAGPSGGIALLVVVVGSFFPVYYRLKNIGMNPWWCLLMIVPIANLLIGVRCLVFQEGYQDTKKLDKAGRIITYVVVGLVGLSVLFLFMVGRISTYVVFGFVGLSVLLLIISAITSKQQKSNKPRHSNSYQPPSSNDLP